MMRKMSFFSQSATTPATNSSEYTTPEGLFGVLRMMALV